MSMLLVGLAAFVAGGSLGALFVAVFAGAGVHSLVAEKRRLRLLLKLWVSSPPTVTLHEETVEALAAEE